MHTSGSRQSWVDSREAEWALGGAVFGLTAAAFQILARLALAKSRTRNKAGGEKVNNCIPLFKAMIKITSFCFDILLC